MVRRGRRRGKNPRVVSVAEYSLRPPVVLQVFDSPLLGEASLGSLLEKVSRLEQLRTSLSLVLNRVAAEKSGNEEVLEELNRLAAEFLLTLSAADMSYRLLSKRMPRNVVEAGASLKLLLRLAAAAGILHQLGKKEEGLHLLRLAQLEIEDLQNARRAYEGLDRWIWLSSYVGDDLAILMREYEGGSTGLSDIILEVALLMQQEIELSKRALGGIKPASRVQSVMRAIEESEAVLRREVLERIQG
ncbi:MAG: hypothetical protein QXO17_06145 [Nitrososphaerota archaeon]|nr:hypothetical protein [Candidatus Calditenuis fumarioli]